MRSNFSELSAEFVHWDFLGNVYFVSWCNVVWRVTGYALKSDKLSICLFCHRGIIIEKSVLVNNLGFNGAHRRNWTADLFLTMEMLYQLSYVSVQDLIWCQEQDSNLRRLASTDLQSVPFGRFGILATINGAWKENRTPNLRFTKPLLCRLSYPGNR